MYNSLSLSNSSKLSPYVLLSCTLVDWSPFWWTPVIFYKTLAPLQNQTMNTHHFTYTCLPHTHISECLHQTLLQTARWSQQDQLKGTAPCTCAASINDPATTPPSLHNPRSTGVRSGCNTQQPTLHIHPGEEAQVFFVLLWKYQQHDCSKSRESSLFPIEAHQQPHGTNVYMYNLHRA